MDHYFSNEHAMHRPPKTRLDDLCRTERYFTSALLTGLLFHDNLRGAGEFFRWLIEQKELRVSRVDDGELVRPASISTRGHLEILTEFNLKRELHCYYPNELAKLIADVNDCDDTVDVTVGQSVPDVVILAGDTLLVIEGKFFVSDQSPARINQQLRSQKEEIELMVRYLAPQIEQTCHVYLSPETELDPEDYECDLLISWEDIHTFAAALVGEAHYISKRLATANARYRASRIGSTGGGVNYSRQCGFAETMRLCREHGEAIVVGFSGGISKLIRSTEAYLLERSYKLDSATDGTGKKNLSNWLSGAEFYQTVQQLRSNDTTSLASTQTRATSKPRTKNYSANCGFNELVEMCRNRGKELLIGFSGGERQLRSSSDAYLRERTYKWDHASGSSGKKNRSNWIRGDRFLMILMSQVESDR
jgi:hypothetical protein